MITSSDAVQGNETRASHGLPARSIESAAPRAEPTDNRPPIAYEGVYDRVDRRLIDTFPASDAVAQY